MNEQFPPHGIEWTRVRAMLKGVMVTMRGFTWNLSRGCHHGCTWQMPDGNIAECYAKTYAETSQYVKNAYPFGFDYHYWASHSKEKPLKTKESVVIFSDSMSDMLEAHTDHSKHGVSDSEIEEFLDVVTRANWNTFILLTKNAPRLKKLKKLPPNLWVGVSTPPTAMNGKPVDRLKYLYTAYEALEQVQATVKFLSIEPLSFDISDHLLHAPVSWAIIGAASRWVEKDKKTIVYQPDPLWVTKAVDVLQDVGVPIFFKGNLKGNIGATHWLDNFPAPTVKCIRCGELWFSPLCAACVYTKNAPQKPDVDSKQLALF